MRGGQEQDQGLHFLFAGAATGELPFLVQEVEDGAQHRNQQDADDDSHDDHTFALRCALG